MYLSQLHQILLLLFITPVGRTLNPKIIQPSLALAKTISLSVIPPTAE